MENSVSRRGFLAGAVGLGGMALLGGCSPRASKKDAADAKDESKEEETVDYTSKVGDTVECDAVVVGLGIAGVAALRSATEAGLRVVGVEKSSAPNCRSSEIAAFGTERLRALGIKDPDIPALANELMIQMAHRANYRVILKWMRHCGEAAEWYCDAYDGLIWLSTTDTEPDDPDAVVALASCSDNYRYGIDHEHDIEAMLDVHGGSYTHRPVLMANVDKAVAGGAQTVFNSPAVQLIVEDGRVTGVICQNLEKDDSYTRYNVKKGVILASGDYSFNEDMLKKYAPWVYENRDKYLFSHEGVDIKGNRSSMGDGQRMGIAAGGHVDVGPHAVMAHIYQFGAPNFLEVNEHGERFCNEDLSMTNISKVMVSQPGSKIFQIMGADYDGLVPGMLDTIKMLRGEDAGFSAESDTLEGLADQLGFEGKHKQNFLDAVERYNELCELGRDEDFGKGADKMISIKAPYCAVAYDSLNHTSVDDVSCLRLLVTMGGLVTDDCARVLDDDSEPIPGLYAVGNTQGGRFVDDYPFTVAGASHGSALTYGYLTGKQIAED